MVWHNPLIPKRISVVVRVILAIIKQHGQSNLKRKNLLFLHFDISESIVDTNSKHGKNMEARADAEGVEDTGLLLMA